MERRTLWTIASGGVAAAALTAVLVTAGPAAAASTTTPTASSSTQDSSSTTHADKQKACERITRGIDHRQKTLDRWNGDASQRGSIAWLQAQAQKVGSSNPQRATLLTDEAARRTQDKDLAAKIVDDLKALQQTRCS